MSSDWVELLTAITSYFQRNIWPFYTDLDAIYLKAIVLGVMGVFTLSQVVSNFIFICFLFILRNNKFTYIRELLYFISGNYIGLMVITLFVPLFGSYWLLLISSFLTKVLGLIVILVLISIFYLKRKKYSINMNAGVVSLLIGFIFPFYNDPIRQVISIRLSFLSDANVINVVFLPLLYTFVTVSPILILCLIIYGFELDLKVLNKPKWKGIIRNSAYVLLGLIAINEIFIYWYY